MIDKELLKILCCPSCQGDLELKEKDSNLVCVSCSKKYLVKDEIPVLLVDYI